MAGVRLGLNFDVRVLRTNLLDGWLDEMVAWVLAWGVALLAAIRRWVDRLEGWGVPRANDGWVTAVDRNVTSGPVATHRAMTGNGGCVPNPGERVAALTLRPTGLGAPVFDLVRYLDGRDIHSRATGGGRSRPC